MIIRIAFSFRSVILPLVLIWLLASCGPSPVNLPVVENAVLSRTERVALYKRTIQAFLDAGRLPIIDLELIVTPNTNLEKMIEVMNDVGVALAAITSHDNNLIQNATKRHPARFIPLTPAPSIKEWTGTPAAVTERVRRSIMEGAFGIGRIPLNLYPGSIEEEKKKLLGEIELQKRTFESILRLSARNNTSIWLDMPPEDNGIGWLERQLKKYEKAKVVWIRSGYIPFPDKMPGYGHSFLRAITLRRPNLFMTLAMLPPSEQAIILTLRKNLIFDPGGSFSPEWRAVIEARIGHFGTASSEDATRAGDYQRKLRNFRNRILDSLTPLSRERMAWRNAWRILTGSEWDS